MKKPTKPIPTCVEEILGEPALVWDRKEQIARRGVITKIERPEEKPPRGEIRVTVEGGKKRGTGTEAPWSITVGAHRDKELAVLCRTEHTPLVWAKTLKINPEQANKLAVARETSNLGITTLINTTDMGRLEGQVISKEGCEIHLCAEDDCPSEGKPWLDASETSYKVGNVEVILEDVMQYQ